MKTENKRMGCYMTVRQIRDENILPFKDGRTIRSFIRNNVDYFYINNVMVVSRKKLLNYLDNLECGTHITT